MISRKTISGSASAPRSCRFILSFSAVREGAKKEMKQRMIQPFEKVLMESPVLKRMQKKREG